MKSKTKKNLITYLIIGGSCLAIGATAGIVGKKVLGQEIVDESGFDPESFKANVDEIYSRYLNYTGSNYSKDFSASELVNIALEKYRRCEYCASVGIGYANASPGGNQTVRNAQIKNGDTYFEESISLGIVGVAERSIQVGKDGPVNLYMTDNKPDISPESANYPSTPSELAHDAYKAKWGKTLDEMFIHIISKKTILDSDVSKSGNEYTVTLNLNVDTSTYYYKSQMVTISNLNSRPVFSKEKLIYTLSSNLDLIHMRSEEEYKATAMGFTASINSAIEYYYYPNVEKNIPEITEKIDYSWRG